MTNGDTEDPSTDDARDDPGPAASEPANPDESAVGGDDVQNLLRSVQRLVDPRNAMRAAQGPIGGAWRSVTSEEPRVQVTAAIVVAIALMLALPARVANQSALGTTRPRRRCF